MPEDILGIVQVTIPVSDLARSAAWYRELLGLTYVREFVNADAVTGCALADSSARYLIALPLRSDTSRHAEVRGIARTSGVHADEHWTEYVDPDRIAVRIVHSTAGPTSFLGVDLAADSRAAFNDTPRLRF